MQRLEFKKKSRIIPPDYQDDVDRIVRAFAGQGYEVNDVDAYRAWQENSESMAAGWLMLPESDEDLVREAIIYLREA